MKREDVLNKFASMMTQHIEKAVKASKPWFDNVAQPMSVRGTKYSSSNALLLMMVCQKFGYKHPVFATFSQIQSYNQGQPEDRTIKINSGEKSFPIQMMHKKYRNGDEFITEEAYNELSSDEQAEYEEVWCRKFFSVFNIEQTDMKTKRPDIWAKFDVEPARRTEGTLFTPYEAMLFDNGWYCPFRIGGNKAAYTYSSDGKQQIAIPERDKFVSLERYYATAFHEMAHSTGHPDLCRRFEFKDGQEKARYDYATEEIIAELTAAYVASFFGIKKVIDEECAPYIKEWLTKLKKGGNFIFSLMSEVDRASRKIIDKLQSYDDCLYMED